jgi:endoglucanase
MTSSVKTSFALLLVFLLASCSRESATATLDAAASSYTIYDNALANNWQDWSWAQNFVDLASSGYYSADKGVHASLTAWGAFSPRYSGSALSTLDYSGLSFKVYHAGGGQRLRVQVYTGDTVAAGSSVVTLTPNSWQSVTLTWAQLGNPNSVKRLVFQDDTGSGTNIYLDDIVLLAGSVVTPNPIPGTWQLSPGINLGGALEAPREGQWGYTVQQDHLRLIKEAGFKSIRLPVRWSSHTVDSNHTIDPQFFARVDQIISWAHAQGLLVVLDMHHWGYDGDDYDSLFINPPAQRARFMRLWQQVAAHYRNYSNDSLYFELLNEPHDGGSKNGTWINCTASLPANQCFTESNEYWASFLQEGLRTIRDSGGNNATRKVIIGNAQWNNALYSLNDTFANALPANDRNITVTVHMYEPFCFTHYNWPASNTCSSWNGTDAEKAKVIEALNTAKAWGERHNRPLYVGEWGPARGTDYASRARYIRYVQGELNNRGLPWAYWDFGSDSWGIFDKANNRFYPELLNALFNR